MCLLPLATCNLRHVKRLHHRIHQRDIIFYAVSLEVVKNINLGFGKLSPRFAMESEPVEAGTSEFKLALNQHPHQKGSRYAHHE